MPDTALPSVKAPFHLPLRRLLELSRAEWRTLAVGLVFLLIGSAAGLAWPQAVRFIIDDSFTTEHATDLDQIIVVLMALFGVQGLAIALRFYLFTVAGERVVTRLRGDVYRHVVAQEVAFFDSRRTGELLNRLSSDTGVLQNTVSVNISMVMRSLAMALGGVGLLLWTSPTLTALMLVVVPPVALGARIFGRMLRRLSRDVQDALAVAGQVAEETISGIRTVRTFAGEPQEVARYGKAIAHAFDLARARARLNAMFIGSASFLGYGAVGVVLWYGGRMVVAHEMTGGELASFMLYTLTVAMSLGALAGLWGDFMRAAGAAERVFELLDREPEIRNDGGVQPATMRGHITMEAVDFRYPSRPDVPVLQQVDLDVRPGEVVALVGPSGGGKSTIAALVPRLYDPDGGRVTVDGVDLREIDASWLRRRVGVVSQEPILFSTSIAENIRYGRPDAADAELEAVARAANAHDFIVGFPDGYATEVGERGVQLSGGQKQRVAIARALLEDPRVLILDEATSALDAESEHLVKDALEVLMKGRTTLVIAHRLSTVRDADRVVVVDGGRIVEQGTHDELVESGGLYRRLLERQLLGP